MRHENHMSPDDHYQDLKRIISAATGKAHRINVIMPFLYEGRQHRRTKRESLDCALALRELSAMGVSNIITFDAHDPRVQNSIPLKGFDNFFPTYQFLKALVKNVPDFKLDNDHLMIISRMKVLCPVLYTSPIFLESIWVCSTNAVITPRCQRKEPDRCSRIPRRFRRGQRRCHHRRYDLFRRKYAGCCPSAQRA